MFFLCPDKPLHGIRSWLRLDRHQRVAGCVGWLFGFVGFFMVCGVDFLRGVLSGWVEMNFDDDVEGSDQSGQSL